LPLKKRCLALLVVLFLAQYIAPAEILSGSNFPLPQIRTGAESPDPFFKQICESICIGLSIYKLDAFEKYTKERIAADLRTGSNTVKYDMENLDIGRKGWTRYYPFSIGDKNFIMRIFLTSEERYQSEVKVLYEGKLDNPAVTFQVLPSLNELLSDCKIKPFRAYSSSQVDKSA
jgi:hypothetical protein